MDEDGTEVRTKFV